MKKDMRVKAAGAAGDRSGLLGSSTTRSRRLCAPSPWQHYAGPSQHCKCLRTPCDLSCELATDQFTAIIVCDKRTFWRRQRTMDGAVCGSKLGAAGNFQPGDFRTRRAAAGAEDRRVILRSGCEQKGSETNLEEFLVLPKKGMGGSDRSYM